MKFLFVVNPRSANAETGRKWPSIFAAITKELPDARAALTEAPMHAAKLCADGLKSGVDCVVAVGGDGTVNEVVNGFFENGAPLRADAALGVLPQGTGGDFKKTFGWTNDLSSTLARLKAGQTRAVDVGQLDFVDHAGKQATRYFANICSFGVSGVVDREVNQSSKLLGGKASFMLGSVKGLLKYTDKNVRFSLDGAAHEARVTTLSVANGRYFGGGMQVAPKADPFDGLFDVTVWSGYTLLDFMLKSKAIYDGSHTAFPGTTTHRCSELKATCDDEVLIDCDGEQPGKLPCTMRVLKGAIRLCV